MAGGRSWAWPIDPPFSRGFAHLHVRSGFSYGYGTATPEELVEAASKTGVGALALTDRDGLYGIPRFLKAAEGAGVSPIVGAEVSVAEAGGGTWCCSRRATGGTGACAGS